MDMGKLKTFVAKYKFHILGIVGLLVVVVVMRKSSSGSTTVIEGTTQYSEDFLLQSQAQSNALQAQAMDIQGQLAMQGAVNSGQLELANVGASTTKYQADTQLAIAGINAEATKAGANFNYLAAKATSDAGVSIAGIQAGASNIASEFAYKLGIDTNKAQVTVSQNQLEATKYQADTAKSMAKYGAIGGVLNTFAQGWAGGYIAQNAKGW